MAHGENAEKGGHPGKEFWKNRAGPPMASPGRFAKTLSHRLERRARCRYCWCEIPWGTVFCDVCEGVDGPNYRKEVRKLTPEVAATLFDELGRVEWFVIERATFTAIRIEQLDLALAKKLKSVYRGTVYRKKHMAHWEVGGRDSEIFAEAILPYLTKKKDLLVFYLRAREQVINSSGRGKASTLDEEDLELRKQVGEELRMMQKGELSL